MKRRLPLWFFLVALLPFLVSPVRAQQERLTILHTNDIHGHLRPLSLPGVPSSRRPNALAGSLQGGSVHAMFELPATRDVGGIARRATVAKRLKATTKNCWLVDAGDFFHYSPFSQEYHGTADVEAMNAAGYDLAGLGNHEFEVTADQLRTLIATGRFPFLCANITDTKTGKPLGKRYEIRQVGALRVGVFGLVTDVSRSRAASGGLVYDDFTSVARSVVAELREKQKVDIVVLISHIGEFADKPLARAVPGIDVIVGGHSHTRLPQGELVPWSGELKPDELNATVIVQAGQWGTELGKLDLLFQKNRAGKWRVSRYQAELLSITGAIPDDPTVTATLDRLWAPHAAKYDEVLATATEDFADRGDDLSQNALYADAVRAALGVEVELDRLGGTFWPILAGPVTRGALIDLDQSPSTIVTFRIKGSALRRLLEQATPVVSGVRYRVNRGRAEQVLVGERPLDDERLYTCAANSAVLSRMEGIALQDRTDTGRSWAETVREGVRKLGTLTPSYDSRRVVVSAPFQSRSSDGSR